MQKHTFPPSSKFSTLEKPIYYASFHITSKYAFQVYVTRIGDDAVCMDWADKQRDLSPLSPKCFEQPFWLLLQHSAIGQ